ncbi:MBL fold metallo-hydrolase [Halocatena marina]|uniref:MBL fold metallo-hydrolase n=1 Tax=Halocatena marina TaxID=2934937 RepID=UPI00200D854B|nr:MBL fold metallo-hydrolase [Halocatena marina]
MVHSDWGDWFVENEVEAVDPDGLSLWYVGCNGFVLRSAEATVYIDPYFGGSVPPRLLRMDPVPVNPKAVTLCDAVFVTHEHLDHMHPPSYLPLVRNAGADVYAPHAAWEESVVPVDRDAVEGRDHVVAAGDTLTIGDLTIHVREGNDPDAIDEVTYVVEHDAGTFFHGGDSRVADAFAGIGVEFDIDLGVLAMGSEARQYYPDRDEVLERRKVYLDHDEAVAAANALQLDRLAPSHYGMWKGVAADPAALRDHAASFDYPRVVDELRVGDRLRIDEPGVIPQRVFDR